MNIQYRINKLKKKIHEHNINYYVNDNPQISDNDYDLLLKELIEIEAKNYLSVANALDLPFEDNSFDLVISITTIHNLDRDGCIQALREIERVSRKNSFITVDAYCNEEEKKLMYDWNLTAKTILHEDEWKVLFYEAGYKGDYYWFKP